MAFVIYGAFFIAKGAQNFGGGRRQLAHRVFPCAGRHFSFIGYVVATVYAVSACAILRRRVEADGKSAAAMELGFLFCILTTITGSIFSRAVWGAVLELGPEPDAHRDHVAAVRVLSRPARREREQPGPPGPAFRRVHDYYARSGVFPDLDRAAHPGRPFTRSR